MNPFLPVTDLAPGQPIGNCVGFDDDTMFPSRDDMGLTEYREAVAYAKYVCEGCPIAISCLGGALKRGEEHGIWGGTTPKERKGLLSGLNQLAKEQAA